MARNFSRKTLTDSVTGYKTFNKFRKAHPEYADLSDGFLRDTIHNFFAYCSEILVKTKHGIILNGIGYFANVVFNRKKVMRLEGFNLTLYNFNTNGDIYISYFFPRVLKGNVFNSFSFKIERNGAREMANQINNKGLRYVCNYHILKSNGNHKIYYLGDK